MLVSHDYVLAARACLTASVGEEGLIKAVSLAVFSHIPLGGVLVAIALSMMLLWWMAWISLK